MSDKSYFGVGAIVHFSKYRDYSGCRAAMINSYASTQNNTVDLDVHLNRKEDADLLAVQERITPIIQLSARYDPLCASGTWHDPEECRAFFQLRREEQEQRLREQEAHKEQYTRVIRVEKPPYDEETDPSGQLRLQPQRYPLV